jgi:hypothetical protein
MIRYFVSYTCGEHRQIGFGWATVSLPQPIRGPEDVDEATRQIEEAGSGPNPVILWYRPFTDGFGG